MTVTKLGIWQTALAMVSDVTIADTTTANTQQRLLTLLWPGVRTRCLTASTWSFATTIATLAVTSGTPDDFAFEYELPDDFLVAIEIPMTVTGGSVAFYPYERGRMSLRAPFVTRDRGGTMYLYTDVQDATLRYIKDTAETFTNWPQPFADYAAAKLASIIAVPLGAGDGRRTMADRIAQQFYAEMRSYDARTQLGEMPTQSRYASGRG